MVRLAPSCLLGHDGLRHAGRDPRPRQRHAPSAPKKINEGAPSTPLLIRWSMQEIRRIAVRLAQRRIAPAQVIAWSLWRRAHQAAAREAHLKIKPQL